MIETIKEYSEAVRYFNTCQGAYERSKLELSAIHPKVRMALQNRLLQKVKDAKAALAILEYHFPEFKTAHK